MIYVHFPTEHQNRLQDAIGSFAYIAVTLFFLISAYGMMAGTERNKNYLDSFWRNRLVSLLIPALLVNIFAAICEGIKGNAAISILYYINGYVMVLLQFCLWFYIVQLTKRRWFADNLLLGDLLLIIGVAGSSIYLYFKKSGEVSSETAWCCERMGLVWGILLYRHFNRFVKWMEHKRQTKAILLCITCLIFGIAYLKYKTLWLWGEYILKIALGIVIIGFLFTSTSNRNFGNKVSFWLGNISYEVYLCHGIMMRLLSYCIPNMDSGWFIFLTVMSTLTVSTAIHGISKPIINVLRK